MKHIKLFLIAAVSTLCFASPVMSNGTEKQTSPPTTVASAATTASTPPFLNASNPLATFSIQGIKDRLPSIKVYHQKYARSAVVAKLNCPLTVATGMVPQPMEKLFEVIDQVTFALNEKEFFKYDIKLVCG